MERRRLTADEIRDAAREMRSMERRTSKLLGRAWWGSEGRALPKDFWTDSVIEARSLADHIKRWGAPRDDRGAVELARFIVRYEVTMLIVLDGARRMACRAGLDRLKRNPGRFIGAVGESLRFLDGLERRAPGLDDRRREILAERPRR